MTKKELQKIGEEVGQEVVKKRGRPVGSGGNKRPDLVEKNTLNVSPEENRRIIRHALANYSMPPIDISDPKQIEQRFLWYFDHCAEDGLQPTVSGFANSLGVCKQTLYNWANGTTRSKSPEYMDSIKKAQSVFQELYERYAELGKINPILSIFLMKNYFGYADKQEVIITPNPMGEAQDQHEIEGRYIESVAEDVADQAE